MSRRIAARDGHINDVATKVKCPGCQGEIDLRFRYPGFKESTLVEKKCSLCESLLLFKFSRPQQKEKQHKGTLSVQAKVLRPSAFLLEMKREEEEWNKKTPEEQNAEIAKCDQKEA